MARKRDEARLRNLELLIAEAGSAVKLARKAGTNESYLSQLRRRLRTSKGAARAIGDKLAHKLERAMGKPNGWLDEPHLDAYRRLSHGHRPEPPGPELGSALHPLISWGDAGTWDRAERSAKQPSAESRLPCPVPCSEDTFVLRVAGESMEPKFHDGELIYVDPQISPENGRYVVVRLGGTEEAVLRQAVVEGGRMYFKALNPDWPSRIVEAGNDDVVRGVVVFRGNAT